MASAVLPSNVHVIGSGLIGASIALSLTAKGIDVTFSDTNPAHIKFCKEVGLQEYNQMSIPDLVFVCVPPASAAEILVSASQNFPQATITDVTSVKGSVLRRAVDLGADPVRLVSAHPMAGREFSGPQAARADLFEDRIWVLTPAESSDPRRIHVVQQIVELMGSTWVIMKVDHHDRVVALVSHAPQILSSLLAGELVDQKSEDLAISGTGLIDMTRVAASDPALWKEILIANSQEVVGVLDSMLVAMNRLRSAINSADYATVEEILTRGNKGRSRVPIKYGGQNLVFDYISVKISDKPGALAELLTATGSLNVNLEDIKIEHVKGRPSGLVQLFVRPGDADVLESGLKLHGFDTRGRS